jgi:predicted glutamine amidotransferase
MIKICHIIHSQSSKEDSIECMESPGVASSIFVAASRSAATGSAEAVAVAGCAPLWRREWE